MAKKWYQSKTVLLNIILTLAAIINLIGGLEIVDPKIILFGSGVMNILLRVWFTNTKIKK